MDSEEVLLSFPVQNTSDMPNALRSYMRDIWRKNGSIRAVMWEKVLT